MSDELAMYAARVSLDLSETGFINFKIEYDEIGGTLSLRLDIEKCIAQGPQGFSYALLSMWQNFPQIFDTVISAAAGETELAPGSVIGPGILVMNAETPATQAGESGE